ncbi:Rpr2-domain-containing protein [Aureobasidium pullulans]|uniref:Rpr2-domain-containing protein n=1 Tax=Aureobasidium pullulans TaxID=5580 RepID=A0A4S9M2J4_AURPU|nr:Rpr2-domain-containing protein [Aureobasidium pullulans]
MAKASADKAKSVPNKHIHARIAFLHQAATHLALHRPPIARSESTDSHVKLQQHGLPLLLAAQLKAVSLKAQIRLSHDMKRSICKVCSTPLMPHTTSETRIENMSRASKKMHADVLVIRCRNCHTEKSFPIGARRQKKKAERKAAAAAATAAIPTKSHENEVEMKHA